MQSMDMLMFSQLKESIIYHKIFEQHLDNLDPRVSTQLFFETAWLTTRIIILEILQNSSRFFI